MKKLFLMAVLALIATTAVLPGCSQQTSENIRLQDSAVKIQKILQAELDSLDSDLAGAAKKLSTTGLTGPEARKILLDLCNNRPYVVDCSTIDSTGKLVAIMPEEFKSFEGADISTQEQIIKVVQTRQPVFSHIFKAVEGFIAVDLECPVISEKGELMGSVSALIKTEVLFDKLARPALNGTGFEKVWAMQKDGWIIFDYDAAEINTNLFTDPLYQPYAELLTLGKQISEKESGCGGYQFLNLGMKEPVKKQVCWSSLSLHGTAWRIIVVQVIGK
jgi:branched-chain amino acid transport system substrate-binding protein